MGPIDYGAFLPAAQGLAALQQGFGAVDSIIQLRQQQAAAEAARQKEAQYRADIEATFADPSPANFSRLMVKYPEQSKAFESAWSTMDVAAKDAQYLAGAQVYNALRGGNVDGARALLDEQILAAENSRKPTAELKQIRDAIDRDPQGAMASVGFVLAATDPDRFSKTFPSQERRIEKVGDALIDLSGDQPREIYRAPQQPQTYAPSSLARLMAERDALPPNDPRRAAYDAAITREAQGTPLINMPGPERAEQAAYGKAMGERAAETVAGGSKASETLASFSLLRGLMQNMETGRLAPAQRTVGAWAQSVGIDPASIGIDPQAAVTGDAITAITNRLAMGLIGSGGLPAANFSNADLQFLVNTVPSLSNTPGGNMIIIQAGEAAAKRTQERARMWLDAEAAGKSFREFEREWSTYTEQNPLFPRIASPEQMQQLPSGTVFTAPDGSIRVKP